MEITPYLTADLPGTSTLDLFGDWEIIDDPPSALDRPHSPPSSTSRRSSPHPCAGGSIPRQSGVNVVGRGTRPSTVPMTGRGQGRTRAFSGGTGGSGGACLHRTDTRHQTVQFEKIRALVIEGLGGSRDVAAEALTVARTAQELIDLGEPLLQRPSLLVQRRQLGGLRSPGQNDGRMAKFR